MIPNLYQRTATQLFSMACAIVALLAAHGDAPLARADERFDILVQQQTGQLVTGALAGSQWTLGRRVFAGEFEEDFTVDEPGFNAFGLETVQLPPGSQALPGNTPLEWVFVPMTIGEQTKNLFYWNGLATDGSPAVTPEDVAFGLPDEGHAFSMFDASHGKFTVTGGKERSPGGVIDSTATDGSLHRHRFFLLESADGMPSDGIYLVALALRMVGLEDSLPLFLVFGTLSSSVAALDDAALPWVEQNVNLLVPVALPGDFNSDGIVDSADYVVWRKAGGSQEEYDGWRANFGNLTSGAGSRTGITTDALAVPEPAAVLPALLAACVLAPRRKRLTVS